MITTAQIGSSVIASRRLKVLPGVVAVAGADAVADQPLSGSCLCGGVRYRLRGSLRGVINCFCSQCRKTSGHHVAATRVNQDNLDLIDSQTLRWYQSSASAERGFCNRCGGNLFWRQIDGDRVSVMAGTIDLPTGLHTVENIHDHDKSDYHALPGLTA